MSLLFKILKDFEENILPYEFIIELDNDMSIEFNF